MTASFDHLDKLIAAAEQRIAEQTARLDALPEGSRAYKKALDALVILRLDLAAFRQSKDAIAEARRLIGQPEPEL